MYLSNQTNQTSIHLISQLLSLSCMALKSGVLTLHRACRDIAGTRARQTWQPPSLSLHCLKHSHCLELQPGYHTPTLFWGLPVWRLPSLSLGTTGISGAAAQPNRHQAGATGQPSLWQRQRWHAYEECGRRLAGTHIDHTH